VQRERKQASYKPTTNQEQNSPTESSLFTETPPKRQPTRGRPPKAELGPEFDEWYAAYPVHKARGDAEKAWLQVIRDGADPQVLIAAAKRYRDDPRISAGYGKFPAGWLRAKCWLDEPATAPSPNGHPAPRPHVSPRDEHRLRR
jgi:hypothetical protein